MSDDNDLYDYVQTILIDRETPSRERVETAMEAIEALVRAEHRLAPHQSIGLVPPEWAHKVPKDDPPVASGILFIPDSLVDQVKHVPFECGTGRITHIGLWDAADGGKDYGVISLTGEEGEAIAEGAGFTMSLPDGEVTIDAPEYDYIEKQPKKRRWWHDLFDLNGPDNEWWRSPR